MPRVDSRALSMICYCWLETESSCLDLGDSGWEHFYTDQWKFLAPEFETGKFDYVLDEQSILPIQLRDGHGEGSFGDVREGELNLDHARESERVSQAVGMTLIAADRLIHSAANLVV